MLETVEIPDVLARFEQAVDAVAGYALAAAPLDPTEAPAELGDRVFSVDIPATDDSGERDQEQDSADVVTTVVVRVQAPVSLAGPNRRTAFATELAHEEPLRKALLQQGPTWTYGLRIRYRGSRRGMLPGGDGWYQVEHTFAVGHRVRT